MSTCPGLHCPGCGGGGGGLAGLAVLTVAGIAVYRVITSRAVAHAVSTAVTIAEITLVSIAGIVVLTGLTWSGIALRRAIAARPRPEPAPLTLVSSRAVPQATRPALPRPGRALPGVPPYGPQEPARARSRRGRR